MILLEVIQSSKKNRYSWASTVDKSIFIGKPLSGKIVLKLYKAVIYTKIYMGEILMNLPFIKFTQ